VGRNNTLSTWDKEEVMDDKKPKGKPEDDDEEEKPKPYTGPGDPPAPTDPGDVETPGKGSGG